MGAQVLIDSSQTLALGDMFQVNYPELLAQYKDLQIPKYLVYEVAHIESNVVFQTIHLKLFNADKSIELLINQIKQEDLAKGMVDNDDQIKQIRIQGYELCYLKHTSNLPLYLVHDEIKFALLTPQNKELWQYWHDELNQPVLHHLLTPGRLEKLKASPDVAMNIYTFSYEQNNRLYFYSAAFDEVTPEQRHLFWQMAANRDSWRVYRVMMTHIRDTDKTILEDIAPEMVKTLSQLTHLAVVQDVTENQTRRSYMATEKTNLPVKTINEFLQIDNLCIKSVST
jgi:hypothetical protein